MARHAWNAPGAGLPDQPAAPTGKTQGDRGFVLDETARGTLLHPSAIEASTSAMEVVAVAGANAVRLVVAHINVKAPYVLAVRPYVFFP